MHNLGPRHKKRLTHCEVIQAINETRFPSVPTKFFKNWEFITTAGAKPQGCSKNRQTCAVPRSWNFYFPRKSILWQTQYTSCSIELELRSWLSWADKKRTRAKNLNNWLNLSVFWNFATRVNLYFIYRCAKDCRQVSIAVIVMVNFIFPLDWHSTALVRLQSQCLYLVQNAIIMKTIQ